MGTMSKQTNNVDLQREDMAELLLTRAEAAAYLGLSVKRLSNMAALGQGPKVIRFPCGSARYEWTSLQAWTRSGSSRAA
ncbi:hypothetical protein GCM10028789_27430 [Sinomonas halotolerans]